MDDDVDPDLMNAIMNRGSSSKGNEINSETGELNAQ